MSLLPQEGLGLHWQRPWTLCPRAPRRACSSAPLGLLAGSVLASCVPRSEMLTCAHSQKSPQAQGLQEHMAAPLSLPYHTCDVNWSALQETYCSALLGSASCLPCNDFISCLVIGRAGVCRGTNTEAFEGFSEILILLACYHNGATLISSGCCPYKGWGMAFRSAPCNKLPGGFLSMPPLDIFHTTQSEPAEVWCAPSWRASLSRGPGGPAGICSAGMGAAGLSAKVAVGGAGFGGAGF